ncbi:MAG: tripartite tricarboxylate transporter substrate binding protein [Betaproteobacteria bacterium]|nr:tripartite tricarboxylate transporter substrate binding protein [Betaproteobacteria bacterium]
MKTTHLVLSALLFAASAPASAQGWSPQKNVEIVVGSAPGGSNDKTARQVERILTGERLLNTTMTVSNRPGGGGTIAFTYVNQRAGDPHTLLIGTTALLSNHILGLSKLSYTDFTPIASLFNDYIVFAVNADSPIRTGKDLMDRLKKDPKSVATGFATTLGSHNHIAAGLLLKEVGGNPRDLKAVAFKGSAEAITALLGGHIDLVTTAAGNTSIHVASGKMRVVGVAAPARFGGLLANVPTWKEQGVNLVFGGWRAIMAPKGLSPAQVAFWEGVLRKATQAPEWRADLEKNFWSEDFVTGAQFRKDLDKDYADMKAVLVDLGLAKE